jgi:hypothetical protein
VTALAKLAAVFAALVVSARALAVIAEARVPLLPGWVVPVPAVLLAAVALLAVTFAARVALAILDDRGPLPYIAVAGTWRGCGHKPDHKRRHHRGGDRGPPELAGGTAARPRRPRQDRPRAGRRRAARLAALGAWVAGHVTELLFVPVIGVPALLAWTAMAA